MKLKRFSLLCVLIFLISAMSVISFAAEYLPDRDGKYTVSLELEKDNEYILFVLSGVYDETNYIEAFNSCEDDEILYFEQKSSDEKGIVTFGPFIPTSYVDSTVLVGGTNYSEPIYAGILRANGATNVAEIEINGVLSDYTVNGLLGEDVEIPFELKLYDSYGYEPVTTEKTVLSLKNSYAGVAIDNEKGKIVIDNMAPSGSFTLVASYMGVYESFEVSVTRAQSEPFEIKLYTDEQKTAEKQSVEIMGVAGVFPSVTVYAKTIDQFNGEMEDSYIYKLDGNDVDSFVFTPSVVGTYSFGVYSVKNPEVSAFISITVLERPDYTGNALTLYNLITQCKEEYNLLGVTKFISSESGKDVYTDSKWTTQASVDAFLEAIDKAQIGLDKFNTQEIADSSLTSYTYALTSALNAYEKTFKAGVRVDATSISLTEQNIRISTEGSRVKLGVIIYPSNHTEKVTWTTSDEAVATVDQTGYVTPVSSGKAVITATTGSGMSASCAVTVYVPIRSFFLSDFALDMKYGDEPYRLTIAATPANHTDVITWTSSNPAVATVSPDGVVTPVWGGVAIITVAGGSEGLITKTCKVTVTLPDWETAEKPTADVQSGKVFGGTKVTLATPSANAVIYYTLDGTVPTKESRVYSTPITITKSCTLKAVAMGSNLFPSEVVSYEYEVVSPMIKAESVRTSAGETVEMTVSLENVPALSELQLSIAYDERLRLIGVEGTNFEFTVDDGETNPRLITFTTNPMNVSGTVLNLTFSATIGIPDGSYDVTVSAVKAVDTSFADVEIESASAVVKVSDVMLGDLNADDEIDIKDVVLLAQYVAEWDSVLRSVDAETTDVNGDDETNIKDVVLLAQYVAEWGVQLG